MCGNYIAGNKHLVAFIEPTTRFIPFFSPLSLVLTSERWCVVFEETDRGQRAVLSQGQLQQKQRDAQAEQHDHVRYEEGAAAVLVAKVGKPPYVTETCNSRFIGLIH